MDIEIWASIRRPNGERMGIYRGAEGGWGNWDDYGCDDGRRTILEGQGHWQERKKEGKVWRSKTIRWRKEENWLGMSVFFLRSRHDAWRLPPPPPKKKDLAEVFPISHTTHIPLLPFLKASRRVSRRYKMGTKMNEVPVPFLVKKTLPTSCSVLVCPVPTFILFFRAMSEVDRIYRVSSNKVWPSSPEALLIAATSNPEQSMMLCLPLSLSRAESIHISITGDENEGKKNSRVILQSAHSSRFRAYLFSTSITHRKTY